ncbi:hypothetical protein OROHE_005716 [Orobanche hederae]
MSWSGFDLTPVLGFRFFCHGSTQVWRSVCAVVGRRFGSKKGVSTVGVGLVDFGSDLMRFTMFLVSLTVKSRRWPMWLVIFGWLSSWLVSDPADGNRQLIVEIIQKRTDPNLTPPYDAIIYSETRKQKPGRTYKTNPDVVKSKITVIQKIIALGNDAEADAIVSNGKSHGRNWLVGRRGKRFVSTSTPAPTAPTEQQIHELMTKIRNDLESELEAKVNKKVQESMIYMLQKIGAANPGLNLDIGEFCVTLSSDLDDHSTLLTQGGTSS